MVENSGSKLYFFSFIHPSGKRVKRYPVIAPSEEMARKSLQKEMPGITQVIVVGIKGNGFYA